MKRQVRLVTFALLSTGLMPPFHPAEALNPLLQKSRSPQLRVSIEVLSNTGGTNLQPYLSALVSSMQSQWATRVAALPAAHDADRRETLLDLTLAKDGRLLALRQQGGEQDEVWSKVAWDSARNNTYQALPTSFKDENLKIRLHFSTQ